MTLPGRVKGESRVSQARVCRTFAGVVANPGLGVPVPDQAAADEHVILGVEPVAAVEPVQAELLVRGACSPILDTAKSRKHNVRKSAHA